MKKIMEFMEKMQPTFQKITSNKYMAALKDGFVAPMYVILFSSIFLLAAYVPNAFGFYWSDTVTDILTKPYSYTMGFFGLIVSATITKALTDNLNKDMEDTNQINSQATMIASILSYLLLLGDPIEGGMTLSFMGTQGMFAAILIAFIVPNIYKVFIKNNITIRMPKEVPPNISETFKSLIPFGATIIFFWIFDMVFRNMTGGNVAEALVQWLSPLFALGNTYPGIAIVWGATAFFWFIGIHGPSIVHPTLFAAWAMNLEANQAAFQAGEHVTNAFTETGYFMTGALGGTGSTLMVTVFFAFLAKSKEHKAVGKASIIPVLFGVNEPILFGGPMVLNPYFMVPFILAPVSGGLIFKFFVDVLGMNAFAFHLPWTTPGVFGAVIASGFDPLSILLVIVLLAVSGLIYYPFFKAYDLQKVSEEQAELEAEENVVGKEVLAASVAGVPVEVAVDEAEDYVLDEQKNILVLCIGGGTSGLLSNKLNEIAAEKGLNLKSAAAAIGSQSDILHKYDAVILAPQAAAYFDELKKDTDRLGIKLATTKGREYISLTNNSDLALEFTMNLLDS